MKIERGVQASPVKAVIHGVEGIGKTTLAAQWPNPLILDTEDGSKRIDCARVVIHDWLACNRRCWIWPATPKGSRRS